MFEGQSLFHIAGQLLLAFLFIATGILNAATKFQQHLDRMIAAGVPLASAVQTHIQRRQPVRRAGAASL